MKANGIGKSPPSLVAAIMIALATSAAARADIITTVESVLASAGSTGNSFEVDLTNTGPSTVTVNSFGFGLSVASTDLIFTLATDATVANAYIFGGAGNSLFGPTISTTPPPPGQSVNATDIWAGAGNGFDLTPGTTVGLGEIFFDVNPSATGPYTVSFVSSETALSDVNTDAIKIDTENSGTITVSGTSPVPEPSSLALFGAMAAIACAIKLRPRIETK